MRARAPLLNGNTSLLRWSAGARRDALRRTFTFVIAFAFLAQAFVVQTHVHSVTQETLTELSVVAADCGRAKGKLPPLPDEKNCPLCRLSAFVGSCVVPLAIVPLPIAVSALLPAPEPALLSPVKSSSHSWQVRAPPR